MEMRETEAMCLIHVMLYLRFPPVLIFPPVVHIMLYMNCKFFPN